MNAYQSRYIRRVVARRSIKKNWIVVVVSALLLGAVAVYIVFFAPFKKVTFSPEMSEYVFGCTSSEFSKADLDLPSEVLSLQKNANSTSNGYLIIKMSYWQWHRFKNLEWIEDFSHLEDWPCIDLSEDYYSITVTVTPEMWNYETHQVEAFKDAVRETLYRIRFVDMTKNSGDINYSERIVKYTEIDEVTGEIIFERDLIVSGTQIHSIKNSGWN